MTADHPTQGGGQSAATMRDALADHYLWQMVCDHAAKTDVAICSCGLWKSAALPSVGDAAKAWAEHALAALKAAPLPPAPDPAPGVTGEELNALKQTVEEINEAIISGAAMMAAAGAHAVAAAFLKMAKDLEEPRAKLATLSRLKSGTGGGEP